MSILIGRRLRFVVSGTRQVESLVGRDLKSLIDHTGDEIRSLLWTGFDLVHRSHTNELPNTGAHITLLMNDSDIKLQTAISRAAFAIGAYVNVIIDPKWEQTPKLWTLGRMLSVNNDLIMLKGKLHSHIEEVSDGASKPVVNVSSGSHHPLQALGDIMCMYQKFGRLKGLTLAYVSPPGPLLNSYLCVLPKVGVNLKFASAANSKTPVSSSMLKHGQALCKKLGTEIHECLIPSAALSKVDVVVSVQHTNENLYLRLANLQAVNTPWAFLHPLPRGSYEIDDDLFTHNNSLVWDSCYSLRTMYAAVILRILEEHEHLTPMPSFDFVAPRLLMRGS